MCFCRSAAKQGQHLKPSRKVVARIPVITDRRRSAQPPLSQRELQLRRATQAERQDVWLPALALLWVDLGVSLGSPFRLRASVSFCT